nr:hypothetical protein [Microseira wollei]
MTCTEYFGCRAPTQKIQFASCCRRRNSRTEPPNNASPITLVGSGTLSKETRFL